MKWKSQNQNRDIGSDQSFSFRDVRLSDSDRLEAFSDGVFSITITLLVFDIVRPGYEAGRLLERLLAQWPNYIAFLASFFWIELSVWRIHRRIGMSGGLLINALLRETGAEITANIVEELQRRHAESYARRSAQVQPLPGAKELLEYLTASKVPWGVATSGRLAGARPSLEALGIDPAHVPVITRDQVEHAKPDPDLFIATSNRLGVDVADAVVIGDSVWDLLAARRARALGIGLLSGGYGREELERAGAYRVYEDPRDLLRHLDEVGVRRQI